MEGAVGAITPGRRRPMHDLLDHLYLRTQIQISLNEWRVGRVFEEPGSVEPSIWAYDNTVWAYDNTGRRVGRMAGLVKPVLCPRSVVDLVDGQLVADLSSVTGKIAMRRGR